jgi:hypothetical protein
MNWFGGIRTTHSRHVNGRVYGKELFASGERLFASHGDGCGSISILYCSCASVGAFFVVFLLLLEVLEVLGLNE